MFIKRILLWFKKNFNKVSVFLPTKKKVKNFFNIFIFLKKYIKIVYKKFNKINKPPKLMDLRTFLKILKRILKKKPQKKKPKRYYKERNKKLSFFRESILNKPFNVAFVIFFKYEISQFFIRVPFLYIVWQKYFEFNHFTLIRKAGFQATKPKFSISFHEQKRRNTNVYFGFKYIFKLIQIWIFSIMILIFSWYLLIFNKLTVLPHFFFFWICLLMLLYWLISGFVFFVKKYQHSRYTAAIQRFWRRSYILFWLIESGLLLVFFYLVINSSQESFYMFDQAYFFKTHLFSWRLFILKNIITVSLITYSYLTLLNFKISTFNKNILFFTYISGLLLYLVWVEFYQIYWVSNFYANYYWAYDLEESIWSLELDGRRTRIINHYIMILFLLKFWHIIFIFGCWIFFVLRSNELNRISFPLYSFNVQNFIILFIMTWLFMYPWFRQLFHWSAEISYFWFYTETHISFYKIFIYDMYNLYYSLYNNCIVAFYKYFGVLDFFNLSLFDNFNDHSSFLKHTIKDKIVELLT